MTGRALLAVARLALGPMAVGPLAAADAQVPVLINGVVDAELWFTDTSSNLLSRNGGRAALVGRVAAWGAVEPRRGLVLYGLVEGAGASSLPGEAEVRQAALRYTVSPKLVIDAGKLSSLVGTFAARRFSNRNPLIRAPDGYVVQYPWGAQVSGLVSMVDYRVGLLSLPEYHDEYTPDPTPILRPAVGAGITPFVGVRLGASYTTGPYLNDQMSSIELAGRNWRSYRQRVMAADLSASFGYFELRAEAGQASYDVPNQAEPVDGFQYYVEGKYTLAPRLYVALRFQRNDYPFIRWIPTPGFWVARKTDFHDEEFGLGFRLSASTLLKASYHQDVWQVDAANQAFVRPGGRAFAMQLSQSFDVLSWFH